MKGRQSESSRIKSANKAVAIVKSMGGQLRSWDEFLEPETTDFESLPRRALKAGRDDVKQRVSKDIKQFCDMNFFGMTEDKLVELYDKVKFLGGLEMPLAEFQQKFARLKPKALSSNPLHSTVRISLWGLQFEFPEKYLADDIETALGSKLNQGLDIRGLH